MVSEKENLTNSIMRSGVTFVSAVWTDMETFTLRYKFSKDFCLLAKIRLLADNSGVAVTY